jgi:hypothetical protein
MNTRTSINLLRQTGIVLIALPEPVTTGLGIACVAAAQYLSSVQRKAQRELVYRKKHNRFPEDFIYPNEVDNNSYTTKKVNFYSYDRSRRHRIPAGYQYSYKAIEEQVATYIKPETSRPEQNHITPDMERLARAKAEEVLRTRESSSQHTGQKMIPRKVNLEALSKQYQDLNKGNNKTDTDIVPCKVNMRLLQQHRDSEKRQNENAKVKAPKLEIRSRDIDAETLINRYRKSPFSGALSA